MGLRRGAPQLSLLFFLEKWWLHCGVVASLPYYDFGFHLWIFIFPFRPKGRGSFPWPRIPLMHVKTCYRVLPLLMQRAYRTPPVMPFTVQGSR